MSENEKLVIPAGVQFDLSGDGVSIEYAGDILLQGEHLRPVGRVVSTKGSVQIQGSMKVGQIESQRGSVAISGEITVGSVSASDRVVLDGTVRFGSVKASGIEVIDGSIEGSLLEAAENIEIRGAADVSNIRAPKIVVSTGELTAKALESTDSISLGSAKLQVDVIIAPNVLVDPETTGRVAVIESDNDLGPNGIRGAFRLKEFAQFTGQNPELFLSERGVGAIPLAEDTFEEEAENTQVSIPVTSSPPVEPPPVVEPEQELEDLPVSAEVYEPEPTPVSVVEEQPEPLSDGDEEGDSEIPPWSPNLEQNTAFEDSIEEDDSNEEADSEIPPWKPNLGQVTIPEDDGSEEVDSEIPPWNSEPQAATTDSSADDEIPAWNAEEREAGGSASEVEAASTKENTPPEKLPERPEPIRVAVEMTKEPDPVPQAPKPVPPIAAPKTKKASSAPKSSSKSPIHKELIGTVNSLVTCYDGKEVPPAITELQALIDEADFPKVRAEITNIWNNLLKHHQRTGTRLQHQVTTTFNTVNTLVRKID